MAAASAMKAIKAICQPLVAISPWAKGEAKVRPSEPMAEIVPMVTLRLNGETVREAIAIAERTGHKHREAALWSHMADIHHAVGRESDARDALTRSVSLFAEIDAGVLEPELWLLSRW